jgi:hypothetical protein
MRPTLQNPVLDKPELGSDPTWRHENINIYYKSGHRTLMPFIKRVAGAQQAGSREMVVNIFL